MDRLMLTSFAHDAHLRFADYIGADTMDFRAPYGGPGSGTPVGDMIAGQQWPQADTYFIEGSAPLYAGSVRGLIRSETVVYLGYDRGLIQLLGGADADVDRPLTDQLVKEWGLRVARLIGRLGIDGAIVASSLVAEHAAEMFGQDAVHVAHPTPDPERYRALADVEPALESDAVATVGRAMPYKGVGSLVDAWPTVRDRHPDATLDVAGPGEHPAEYEHQSGVSVAGFVEDLPTFIGDHALAVQPSRGDAFPLTVLEAMRAGVPCLVTETTGTKDAVERVSEDLIVGESSAALAEGISWYLDLPIEERRDLARRAREVAADYEPADSLDEFAEAVRTIEEST